MDHNQASTAYRSRIYANYGSNFQDADETFNERTSQRWGSARKWHLRRWLPKDKMAVILDLACGGGKLLHFYKMAGYTSLHGVDISHDQVALSQQITPDVVQADVIQFLQSHPNSFDLISGFDIVEHFFKDEVLSFLDAAHAALKPGGRIILQTPNAEGPWGAQHRYNDLTHEVGFNPNSLTRIMQLAGFTSLEVRECDPPPWHHSIISSIRAALWQTIRLTLMIYNLIETGSTGDRVFTRVFLVSGVREQ